MKLERSQRAKNEKCWTADAAALGVERGIGQITERRAAERLLHRVVHNYRNPVELDRYGLCAPLVGVGGVMHYGLGGSEDSSWTIGYFWRSDGLPIWCDPLLVANDRGITSVESAQEFADQLMVMVGNGFDVTVELRHGTVYVFLPPIDCELEFLTLVHGIELTATFLMMPVRLEGFGPPVGDIIFGFELTPGLDVADVDIHPMQPWPQLLVLNSILERSAIAVKFMMQFSWDGRCLEPMEEAIQTSFPSSVFLRSATETRSLQSAVTV